MLESTRAILRCLFSDVVLALRLGASFEDEYCSFGRDVTCANGVLRSAVGRFPAGLCM